MQNKNINFSIIKNIQDKADIVFVISQFIKLNKKGNNYVGLCPFHADNRPSLVVSPKKKIFKCFVCGAKGNVFGFVQQYKKVNFIEAVKIIAKLINFDISNLMLNHESSVDPYLNRLSSANVQVKE
jgi:DNA primase